MNSRLKEALEASITEATSHVFEIEHYRLQSGGCINDTYIIGNDSTNYFVKLNTVDFQCIFEAEAAALEGLAAVNAIRVPQPIAHNTAAGRSYLVLETLPFGAPGANGWERMGQQLAQLHRKTTLRFGWYRDNVIGSTPQYNTWTDEWPTFFREQRLRPQFELAQRNGYQFEQAETLLDRTEDLLARHSPAPSLLHGDLWSGNAGFLKDGSPVIFDPATYYGDRETDLAFTEFFGGFPSAFYQAYQNEWQLPPGYEQRKELYNLYHVLNHANLFGGAYASQAAEMTRSIIRNG